MSIICDCIGYQFVQCYKPNDNQVFRTSKLPEIWENCKELRAVGNWQLISNGFETASKLHLGVLCMESCRFLDGQNSFYGYSRTCFQNSIFTDT